MPDFTFQQYASRGAQGYEWLSGRQLPPVQWIQDFEGVLSKAFPTTPCDQATNRAGGVYLSSTGDYVALFTFCPAGPDYFGRQGGIVTNVLFCKTALLPVPSLKKAWEHPCLRAKGNDNIPAIVFISLDQDFGTTPARQKFFGALKDWQHDKPILMKCNDMGNEKDFALEVVDLACANRTSPSYKRQPTPMPPAQNKDPRPPIDNNTQDPFSQNIPMLHSRHALFFVLGLLLGIGIAFAGKAMFKHSEPRCTQESSGSKALFQCEVPSNVNLSHGRFIMELDCEVIYHRADLPSTLEVHSFEIRKKETNDGKQY